MLKFNAERQLSLTGHTGSVYTLSTTNQANEVISAGADGFIVKWNTLEAKDGVLLAKSKSSTYAMLFLPEENSLIIGLNHNGIQEICLKTNTIIRSLALDKKIIFDIKVYDKILFIACSQGDLIFVDLLTFKQINTLHISDQNLRSVEINPSINQFAVSSSANEVHVFSLSDLKVIKKLSDHKGSVFTLAYSPDKRFLLTGSMDASFKIYDTQKLELKESIAAHSFTINTIKFNPSGTLFASCSKDKTIKIWDTEYYQLRKVLDAGRYNSHLASVNKLLWINDMQLASCSDDKTIVIWSLEKIK